MVIATIHEKTGGGTKYINRRDINYIPAAITEENYRKNLTSVISQYVQGHQTYKYAQVTDLITKQFSRRMRKNTEKYYVLTVKDNVRHTLYAEVLLVISSFENGVGAAIQEECKQNGKVKLTIEEVERIVGELAEHPMQKPYLNDARSKMARVILVSVMPIMAILANIYKL